MGSVDARCASAGGRLTNREIDALIAEKAIGGEIFYETDQGMEIPNLRIDGKVFYNWNPLTDPAASKQLRDKMRADGWNYSLHTESPIFWCSFISFDGRGFIEDADTEEMAVALAALKAKGVEL